MAKILNVKNVYDNVELTSAVNIQPYQPRELEVWLPWNVEGVTTRFAFIEVSESGALKLLKEADPMSGRRNTVNREKRKGFTVRIPYFPQYESIMAEMVQGRRAFGSAGEAMTYLTELTKLVNSMKDNNAVMREWIRACALQGKICDDEGEITQDLRQLSGRSPVEHSLDLSNTKTDVIQEIIEAKQKIEDKLGAYGGMIQGYMLIAGRAIHPRFTRHASVLQAFNLWSSTGAVGNLGSAYREDVRAGFPIVTDVNLVSYGRGKVNDTWFLDPNKALLCPILPGLYQTRYAPGTGKDVVNTPGIPEYANIEPLPFNKGDELEMEMAVVSFLERQDAICEITSSN